MFDIRKPSYLKKQQPFKIAAMNYTHLFETQLGSQNENEQHEHEHTNMNLHGAWTYRSKLEEIRSQREKTGLQSDHVSRLQTRQLTEHVATIKALEVSLDSRVFGENMQILKKGVGSVFCAVNACFNNKGFMY